MTKWIIFTCFFITVNIVQAQNSDSDSSFLHKESLDILKKEITFSQEKGKLENALQQLSLKQNIKFSYSHDRIQQVEVEQKEYTSINLASLLNSLLFNSGFNFIMVGRIIVIVEDDKNKNIVSPVANTSENTPDSAITYNVIPDTSPDTSQNHPRSDISQRNSFVSISPIVQNHIYTTDLNLAKLPNEERKKIHKLYEKELKWAYHYKNRPIQGNDTLPNTNTLPSKQYSYYVSGSLGIIKYEPRIKGNSEFSWNEDLNYTSKINTSIRPEISFGFVTRYLMAGIGLGYQQLKMKEEAHTIYKKSNGIGGGKGNQPDTFNYFYSDKYSILSVPLQMLLYKQRKNLFAGIGTKLEVDFISAKGETDKYKSYYLAKVEAGNYSFKNSKVACATSVKAFGGIMVKNDLALTVGAEYNYYLSSLTRNSVFSFYSNSLQFELSLFYFLNKSDIKNILGR